VARFAQGDKGTFGGELQQIGAFEAHASARSMIEWSTAP
jgi:hypothetical protein